jgi:hypothetical protein
MKTSTFLLSALLAVALLVPNEALPTAAKTQSYGTNDTSALTMPLSTIFDDEFNSPNLNSSLTVVQQRTPC